MTVVSIATLRALPGREEDLAALLSAIRDVALSEQEPGCTAYRIFRANAASDFACVEHYVDEAAVSKHAEDNKGVHELVKALQGGGIVDGNPVIKTYREF
ncbi:hypothetical protein JCM10207_007323 [Rhodosporidiobolus poonsookiae]